MTEIKDFSSPLQGRLMKIDEVPDEVFSTRAMGAGFAIDITGNKVTAPMDGTISSVYPTGHAVLMTLDNGIEVMIHVGLDSYKIAGINTIMCKAEDHVSKGDVLVTTDVKKLKKNGCSTISPIVFLSQEKISLTKTDAMVDNQDEGFVTIER